MNLTSGRLSERLTAALAGALFLLSCGGSITYTPEDDAEALKRIEKTWTTSYKDAVFTLSLCENIAANASHHVDGCTYAHLVRSVDPSPKKTVNRASSCEDCFLGIMTNVIGTFRDAQGKEYVLEGIVSLGTEFNEDPYDGDFGLMLSLDGKTILEGRISEEGTLVLSGEDLYALGFDVDEAEEKIEIFEEGSCRAPTEEEQDDTVTDLDKADGGEGDAEADASGGEGEPDAESESEEELQEDAGAANADGGQSEGDASEDDGGDASDDVDDTSDGGPQGEDGEDDGSKASEEDGFADDAPSE